MSLHFNPEERRRLIPVIQTPIASSFNKGDWIELGYKTGTEDFISTHPPRLRSLDWGDDDYGGCIYQAIEYMLDCSDGDENLAAILGVPKVTNQIKKQNPDIFNDFVDSQERHQKRRSRLRKRPRQMFLYER